MYRIIGIFKVKLKLIMEKNPRPIKPQKCMGSLDIGRLYIHY